MGVGGHRPACSHVRSPSLPTPCFVLPLRSVLYFLPVSLAFPVHRPLEIRDRVPHGRLPLTCAIPVQGSLTWEYVLEKQGRIQKQMCDWGRALLVGVGWGWGALFPISMRKGWTGFS